MTPTPSRMGAERSLRTGAWYGDRELHLPLPEGWSSRTFWPETPPPLSDSALARAFREPTGQEPISRLARGVQRPVVIVDDLTRPTPADRIMPFLLHELEEAGVSSSAVTVVLATGTHGAIPGDAIEKKVGAEAASACRLLVHDDKRDLTRIGSTSYGTPLLVNREVARSDFVVGLGGVYPQHSTGFGGGSKIALGVLGRRSITHLHYGHPSMEGSYEVENDFRRDLDEIAEAIGLRASISAHVNAQREIVRLVTGDHRKYYAASVAFSRAHYGAPLPGDAEIVISNAYPMDVSLTFMRSKGIVPLLHAAPHASRVVVAACSEGVGHHGLFPFVSQPLLARQRHLARHLLVSPSNVPRKAVKKVAGLVRRGPARRAGAAASNGSGNSRPILLYAPGRRPGDLPEAIPGMIVLPSWERVLERLAAEQGGRGDVTVVVYPSAPLQVLDLPSSRGRPPSSAELDVVD